MIWSMKRIDEIAYLDQFGCTSQLSLCDSCARLFFSFGQASQPRTSHSPWGSSDRPRAPVMKGRKAQRQRLALIAALVCAVLLSDRERQAVTIDRSHDSFSVIFVFTGLILLHVLKGCFTNKTCFCHQFHSVIANTQSRIIKVGYIVSWQKMMKMMKTPKLPLFKSYPGWKKSGTSWHPIITQFTVFHTYQ